MLWPLVHERWGFAGSSSAGAGEALCACQSGTLPRAVVRGLRLFLAAKPLVHVHLSPSTVFSLHLIPALLPACPPLVRYSVFDEISQHDIALLLLDAPTDGRPTMQLPAPCPRQARGSATGPVGPATAAGWG